MRSFKSKALLLLCLSISVFPGQFAEASSTTGSAYFVNSGQYLSIPGSSDLAFGTGDFTIEWWMYMTGAPQVTAQSNYPRTFWMSSSPVLGVSLEGSPDPSFYFWVGGAKNFGTMANFSTTYQNRWVHVAVERVGTSLKVFLNGTQFGLTNLTSNSNFTSTTTLFAIGNRADEATTDVFPGYLTNFHIVKGSALYSGSFTPSTMPTAPNANSKLLLNFNNSGSFLTDSSGTGKTVTNNSSVTFSATSPPWLEPTTTTSSPTWSGSLQNGSLIQLSAAGSVAGKITFLDNGKRIAKCISLPTEVTSPFTATCNWKVPTIGLHLISASLKPTDSAYASSISQAVMAYSSKRATLR